MRSGIAHVAECAGCGKSSRMTPVRILIVDDAADFVASAADFLSRDSRVEVVGQASDGAEGVRMAAALSPDLVLMDLLMPLMNGLEATRRIMMSANAPRVVIISMYDEMGIRRNAMDAGAAGFIAKANFAELAMAEIDRFSAAADSSSERQ